MIRIVLAVGIAGFCACDGARAEGPEPFQGVVELEDRILGFEVPGRLLRVSVIRGQEVEEDTEIAALDDTVERISRGASAAQLAATEAHLDLLRAGSRPAMIRQSAAQQRAAQAVVRNLEREVARYRGLLATGATTQATVDRLTEQLAEAQAREAAQASQLAVVREGARAEEIRVAEAEVEAARASLAALDERLAKFTIRSGLDGVVLDVPVEPGEVVAPGTPVATVADPTEPFVDVFVPEGDISRVRVGQHGRVRIDALEEALPVEVEDVGRRTEFTPRYLFSERERPNLVVRVRVRIRDPEQKIRAGVPAFVTLEGM